MPPDSTKPPDAENGPHYVTEAPEMVRLRLWVSHHWPEASVLFRELGILQSRRFRLGVPRAAVTDAPGLPGDVDLLAFEAGAPEIGVAVEAKALTVLSEDLADGAVRRLQRLPYGADQVNGLAAVGFARVYLLLLVSVDGRDWGYLPPVFPVLDRLRSAVAELQLDTPVGILAALTVQANDRSILDSGAKGITVLRRATTRVQPPELTRRISALEPDSEQPPQHPFPGGLLPGNPGATGE